MLRRTLLLALPLMLLSLSSASSASDCTALERRKEELGSQYRQAMRELTAARFDGNEDRKKACEILNRMKAITADTKVVSSQIKDACPDVSAVSPNIIAFQEQFTTTESTKLCADK